MQFMALCLLVVAYVLFLCGTKDFRIVNNYLKVIGEKANKFMGRRARNNAEQSMGTL